MEFLTFISANTKSKSGGRSDDSSQVSPQPERAALPTPESWGGAAEQSRAQHRACAWSPCAWSVYLECVHGAQHCACGVRVWSVCVERVHGACAQRSALCVCGAHVWSPCAWSMCVWRGTHTARREAQTTVTAGYTHGAPPTLRENPGGSRLMVRSGYSKLPEKVGKQFMTSSWGQIP